MRAWDKLLGISIGAGDRAELLVAELSLARAFYAGVPAARLLARVRLELDQRDLEEARAAAKPSSSTWDGILLRSLPSEQALERVRRAVVRHTRSADSEGPLPAQEATIAALAHAVAYSADVDASAAEALNLAIPPDVADSASFFDRRLARSDVDMRVLLFEACVRFATAAYAGPWSCDSFLETTRRLDAEAGVSLLRPSAVALYPRVDPELDEAPRRMVQLERADLERFVMGDPRELAKLAARAERDEPPVSSDTGGGGPSGHSTGPDSKGGHAMTRPPAPRLDKMLADVGRILGKNGALIFALLPPDQTKTLSLPSLPPSSWMPADWSTTEALARLSDALERGVTTVPRLRGLVARGGDAALDAIGAEMLRVAAHPFASSAFAEVLARSGRPRDVMRLVTYFAVAPDPTSAARALSLCTAPELPTVLNKWLEAMLPSDGALANPKGDPETSSGARLTACISALKPYPQLHKAVRGLLSRLSEAPPPSSGSRLA
jgi:hypothetical protein